MWRDNPLMVTSKRRGGRPSDVELSEFGKRFALAFARSGIETKKDFLIAAGNLQPAQFRRYEIGETIPNIAQAREWARILGCRVADLVGGEEDEAAEAERLLLGDPHPVVEIFIEESSLPDDEADHLRAFFKRTAHHDDVRDMIKGALEKYQLRKLRSSAEPQGGRRRLADRDAEIAARKRS